MVEKPPSKGEACPFAIVEGQKVQLEEVSSLSNYVLPHNKGDHHDPLMDPPSNRPMNLKYYQPFHSGNMKCVSSPLEVVENGSKAWKNCLVGYFIEKKLSFSLVNNIAMRILGNRGLLEVLANEKGFYFFKFSDDEACSNVLEACPWLFAGRMVKLFNIPHEYWNEEGLSHIASAVGKPLYADSLIESMKKISFARVCIEIDASCDLVDSFDLFMSDSSNAKLGENVEILVEYQWKPKIYTEFKSFGHSITNCPKLKPLLSSSENVYAPKLKQEWRRVNKRDAPMCNDQCTDVNSPTTASPDHSLWHSKIKNIDEVTVKGLSSPMEPSSKKKKKKQTAKKGNVHSRKLM
ncbi:hypothetical protein Ddye_004932 [Dipteronia dyeriana]|uniref:DUF4283 domain-containing protein n=1 Tax=Dipteronia dyeriana TaxID=168575 RepID=A0AAD9XFA9_9ROSI|nr:hypothetical protein Ddye_004932 [Dipteronia dyeriana]